MDSTTDSHAGLPEPRSATSDTHSCYHDLVMACDQAVMVCVESEVVLANGTAVGLLGAVRTEEIVGRPVSDFFALSHVIAEDDVARRADPYVETMAQRLDRSALPLQLAAMSCRYGGRDAIQILFRSVAQRSVLEHRVQFLLRHDILTELPNRTEFRDRAVGAMARARRNGRQMAVMSLNVDNFSAVNREHGAEIGDVVLQQLATRLKDSIRLSDAAGRLGSDGFGMILEGLDQREQAAVVANRIMDRLKPPISAGNIEVKVSCSAGVAAYPGDAEDVDTLLRMADVAMLAAKGSGRGMFRFYFPELEAVTRRDVQRRQEIDKRIATLTAREREVMDVLVDGNSNKAIAYLLGASPRTIENHRAKVMAKMLAESLPDLVRMVLDSSRSKK